MKKTVLALYIVVIAVMAVATMVERYEGTEYVAEHIYGAWWFTALWALLTAVAIFYFVKRRVRRLSVVTLHLSFVVILAGALLTHLTARRGIVLLRKGEVTNQYLTRDMRLHSLPFSITLEDFEIEYYEGTNEPSIGSYNINGGYLTCVLDLYSTGETWAVLQNPFDTTVSVNHLQVTFSAGKSRNDASLNSDLIIGICKNPTNPVGNFTPLDTVLAIPYCSPDTMARFTVDFSGYTDIAIGLSLLMGFHLPRNFNSPYKAENCSNFWKRWHISLSRWLQNYLYIPLGGNRNITFGTYFWIATLTLSALILSGNIWIAIGALLLALSVILTAWRCPDRRKKIYANLNSMITMLLGGLWHGASLNFLIWGGLRDANPWHRAFFTTAVTLGFWMLTIYQPAPLWRVFLCFTAFIAVSAWLRMLNTKWAPFNSRAWAILVTFTFISFTRLFFRSGSNLDPATANEEAWQTASQMITRIGSRWSGNEWEIMCNYRNVFVLFLLGMIIHWLPEDWKRRYRLAFAALPLPVMSLVCILAVLIIFQFVSAEMQPFIYFQF